jgi:hypothetical protein
MGTPPDFCYQFVVGSLNQCGQGPQRWLSVPGLIGANDTLRNASAVRELYLRQTGTAARAS